jgi:tape measure domain-containing protein
LADVLIGDVVARLRADTAQFTQAIQTSLQQFAQLQQAMARTQTTQAQGQQSTAQLATAYTTSAQSIARQTQAYNQASQASQAYVQAQTQSTTAAQQQVQQYGAVTQALQQTTQAAQTSGGALQAALSVAGGIGIATSIEGLLSAMVRFGQSVVTVGTQLQTLRASLSNVSGGVQQGQQAFGVITDTANRYGLSLQSLAASYRSLVAATRGTALEGQDTQRLFTALAAASRTYGLTTEQTGRALTSFQQIISKGVVSQEELRQQLGEALPGAMQIAARAFGVTTAALNEMITKGIDSTEFVRRFTTQLTTELPTGTRAVETAAQAFNRLGNEILQLKEHIANSGLLQFLADVAGRVASILEALRKADEQQKTATQTRASQATGFTVNPADAQKLLVITEQLTQAEDALRGVQVARQQGAFGILTGFIATDAQIAKAQQTVDTLRQQQTALVALAKAREGTRQGVAARLEGVEGGDPLREQQERARDAEAANQRLKTLLDQTDTSLTRLTDQAKETPQVFGTLTGNAAQKIEFLDNRIKILRENLEKITTAIVARPGAQGLPAPELQTQKTDLTAQLTQATAQKQAIEDALEAQKKAEREAEQSRRRTAREAEQEAERATTQALDLDARLERLRGTIRRPDENKAEEAATRVRVQGARDVAEIEKTILTLQQSQSLQKLRPEALGQFRELREQILQATDAQAKLASDEVLKRQIAPLEELAVKYGLVKDEVAGQSEEVRTLAATYNLTTKEVLDLVQAEKLAAELQGTAKQEQAQKYLDIIKETLKARAAIEQQVPRLEQEALASQGPGLAAVRGAAYTRDLESQLEQLSVPREERQAARLRSQARRKGVELSPEQEALLKQIEAQQQWNDVIAMTERIGDAAAQTLTQGLQSIVEGTQSVSQAFKAMAQSILKSIAEITLNEGFKSLIRLGLGILTTALTSGASTGGGDLTPVAEGSGVGDIGIGTTLGSGFTFHQHGGVVNKPTRAIIGENPAMNPEYVLNTPQMRNLMTSAMQAAPSAGGQAAGGDVAVILVDNRGQAERAAAQQRGLGRKVIIQEVVNDLSQGSGSTIGRAMRAGGH